MSKSRHVAQRKASAAKKQGNSRRMRGRALDPTSAYAHGFFSAIVAGPMVMPTEWLQRFLALKHESIEELNASAGRVMDAYNDVAERLLRQRRSFGNATLEIARKDATGKALVDWQRGFCDAMDLRPDEWTVFLSRLPRNDALEPLAMISQLAEDPIRRVWLADRNLRENLGRSLAVMTARLWEAYRDQPFVQLEFEDADEPRREPKRRKSTRAPIIGVESNVMADARIPSFATDIRPMFTAMDVEHMKAFDMDLSDRSSVEEHAEAIYQVVSNGSMPPPRSGEERWTAEMCERFKLWKEQGCPP